MNSGCNVIRATAMPCGQAASDSDSNAFAAACIWGTRIACLGQRIRILLGLAASTNFNIVRKKFAATNQKICLSHLN